MAYYLSKNIGLSFDDAVEKVYEELSKEGFGVLTQIDVTKTMKEKLNMDMPKCLILGACHPNLAYQVLEVEPHIGVLLPCNVVLRQDQDGKIEIAAMDPVEVMSIVLNPVVMNVAMEVRKKLKSALDKL